MARFRTQLFLFVSILLSAGVLLLQSTKLQVQAEPAITPTLHAIAWNYLPAAFGNEQGPTVTPRPPLPTLTASPTSNFHAYQAH